MNTRPMTNDELILEIVRLKSENAALTEALGYSDVSLINEGNKAQPYNADPSCTTVQLAEMILSDCGCSSNNTLLVSRVANRIDSHMQAAQPVREPLTDDQITTIAHRMATKYTHRSDPTSHAYGFVKHTLVDFVRAIERAHHIGGDK